MYVVVRKDGTTYEVPITKLPPDPRLKDLTGYEASNPYTRSSLGRIGARTTYGVMQRKERGKQAELCALKKKKELRPMTEKQREYLVGLGIQPGPGWTLRQAMKTIKKVRHENMLQLVATAGKKASFKEARAVAAKAGYLHEFNKIQFKFKPEEEKRYYNPQKARINRDQSILDKAFRDALRKDSK